MNKTSYSSSVIQLPTILCGKAQAYASVAGSDDYPGLSGVVRFYQTGVGVVVYAEIHGLPYSNVPCRQRVFGFHIHTGTDCGGTMADPFSDAMAHYNPHGCEHPCHAGDLPPLFENSGFALCVFLTDRFTADEIVGKTVIIHDRPDDFTTQPSGNSGTKIACGVIETGPSPTATPPAGPGRR